MIIYKNRYQAEKHKRGDERVVKVSGGYAVMSCDYYRTWKAQK